MAIRNYPLCKCGKGQKGDRRITLKTLISGCSVDSCISKKKKKKKKEIKYFIYGSEGKARVFGTPLDIR